MMNKINATGILIRTGKGKSGHEEITVVVKRPRIEDANIQFVLETTLSPEIQLGKPVMIEGYIRGFHLRDSAGKSKVTQYFVASKVKPAVGDLESVFGVKGHFNPRHEFKLFVEGTVNSVLNSADGWKSLLVSLDGEREIPDVAIIGFRKNDRIPEYEEISKKDRIVACLSVRTSKKNIKGEERKYENLVVEDLVITNRDISQASVKTEVESLSANTADIASFDFLEEDE